MRKVLRDASRSRLFASQSHRKPEPKPCRPPNKPSARPKRSPRVRPRGPYRWKRKKSELSFLTQLETDLKQLETDLTQLETDLKQTLTSKAHLWLLLRSPLTATKKDPDRSRDPFSVVYPKICLGNPTLEREARHTKRQKRQHRRLREDGNFSCSSHTLRDINRAI